MTLSSLSLSLPPFPPSLSLSLSLSLCVGKNVCVCVCVAQCRWQICQSSKKKDGRGDVHPAPTSLYHFPTSLFVIPTSLFTIPTSLFFDRQAHLYSLPTPLIFSYPHSLHPSSPMSLAPFWGLGSMDPFTPFFQNTPCLKLTDFYSTRQQRRTDGAYRRPIATNAAVFGRTGPPAPVTPQTRAFPSLSLTLSFTDPAHSV